MVGGGQLFISHLIAVHNFVEQSGPAGKADFASQAGLGTVSLELLAHDSGLVIIPYMVLNRRLITLYGIITGNYEFIAYN